MAIVNSIYYRSFKIVDNKSKTYLWPKFYDISEY